MELIRKLSNSFWRASPNNSFTLTGDSEDIKALNDLLIDLQQLDLSRLIKVGSRRACGGFADVYDGLLPVNGKEERKVAVKCFRVFSDGSGDFAKSITRELRVWASLDHVNVLRLLGFANVDGLPSLVSEWMEKGTLKQYMETHTEIDVIGIAGEIAHGLEYLHDHGVVHSDLKSYNILVTADERPVLCDFGISRLLVDSKTVAGPSAFVWSTRWMAVELVNSAANAACHQFHTKSTDVWAFGMVLYELLSRRFPYHNIQSDLSVMLAIASGQRPEKPCQDVCNSDASSRLWKICTKCWDSDPIRRPRMAQIASKLKRITHPQHVEILEDRRFKAHKKGINSVAFSSDGEFLATASDDMSICIWEVKRATPSHLPLFGHKGVVWSIVWSPLENLLVSGSGDNTIRKWDVTSGSCSLTMASSSRVLSVSFSPDGHRVVSGHGSSDVSIWDVSNGKLVLGPLKGHGGWVHAVSYSPDGRTILSSSGDASVIIWDASTGVKLFGPLRQHTSWVRSMSYHPTGRNFVTGSSDNTLCIWDPHNPLATPRRLCGHNSWVRVSQYSPDGEYILSASGDGTLRIWDVGTGESMGVTGNERTRIMSAAFSTDGQLIASGDHEGNIVVWRLD